MDLSTRCDICARTVKQNDVLRSCATGCGKFVHPTCVSPGMDGGDQTLCLGCRSDESRDPETVPPARLLANVLFLTDLVLSLRDELADARAEIRLLRSEEHLKRVLDSTRGSGNRRPRSGSDGSAAALFAPNQAAASSAKQSAMQTPGKAARKRTAGNVFNADQEQLRTPKASRKLEDRDGSDAVKMPPPATPRPQRVLVGTGDSSLPIAAATRPDSEYPDRVLISRVKLGIEANDILKYVLTITDKVKKVTTMITKAATPTSSSFVVELERGAGKEISDPTKWSKGILVKKFHGTLASGQIGSEAVTETADTFMDALGNEAEAGSGNV